MEGLLIPHRRTRAAHRCAGAVAALAVTAGGLTGCGSDNNSAACVPDGSSVARVFNDAALDAVRRDFPAPTVHARNLFHLSVAMWDAWAAFDNDATAYIANADATKATSRESAIAFAAHRVLTSRYAGAVGADASLAQFDLTLEQLCLSPDEPDALGVEVADAVLSSSTDDGSLEESAYVADFDVVNEPLILSEPGTEMHDPNRWQQLLFEVAQTQNGQLLESNVQDYVGPHWGHVRSFALAESPDGLPIDPGAPPLLGTATEPEFLSAVVEVIRASSQLDSTDGVVIDIGPGAIGNAALGESVGAGREANPVSGDPYEPNVVPAADYYRVVAEFWADGPASETPPGHWNTLANGVTDRLDEYRIAGGESVDRLEWDVSLYFALNGALHDAAIAAWGAKAVYDYARPISMIRYLGGRNELPPEPGLIEIVTAESSAPGERHELLADHVGETAVRTWAPEPIFFGEELPAVRWIRAVDWLPYQRRTFVTPAFPGYVSGHSTFSRAAAEVLTEFTGSESFPGGMGSHVVEAGDLEFDDGPAQDVVLQWSSYRDAADEAGRSRIYGGIHVEADDLAGRELGAVVGEQAWELARTYLRTPSAG